MKIWEEIKGKFVRLVIHSSIADRIEVQNYNDDEDQYVDHNSNFELESISGLAIIIEYVNSKGEKTTRAVTCRKLILNGDNHYVTGFCHTKKALRQFRVDRINEIFDHKTGASLNPVSKFFSNYSPNEITKCSFGFGLSVKLRADFVSLLNALVFLAKCDAEYHPLERSTLENLTSRFWLRMEILSEPDENAVLDFADRLAPDAETFWVSMHRIAKNPTLTKIMQQTAVELIEADGTIAKEEFYWGAKIDQFFAQNA